MVLVNWILKIKKTIWAILHISYFVHVIVTLVVYQLRFIRGETHQARRLEIDINYFHKTFVLDYINFLDYFNEYVMRSWKTILFWKTKEVF